jgi:hypothetical protein
LINHSLCIEDLPANRQRIQISASTITAASKSPTNRIMMTPILGGVLRNVTGPGVSGRTLFTGIDPAG